MREIVFDTETTGLDHRVERVIEIGAIELVNRFPTGRTFHVYINPDGRAIDPEAQAVHGITMEQLADKPTFAGIIDDFEAFIDGATLVAHNAGFDMNFINAEFARFARPPVDPARVVDTLAIARRKHPMGPNSLDALCKRYGIDNSHRTRHGALLDSGLLAEVYIELLGGKQATFGLSVAEQATSRAETVEVSITLASRAEPLPSRLTEAERQAHAKLVASLGEKAIWLKPELQAQPAAEA
ncbi:DNA polymerase III subunit epsilon [Mesorhizobium australicum]|uniref:DNA polymerase III subunit epsilon n=1 Tax=Mesorhizobium australicum TaxID=536018 RepID=A0A1X7MVI3_9HYPH|nr:DNA polymerase III subunit epsilon [Mesorhizobium australicum]SMH28355.1 DNA polymerase III, epsilon subunit [Mesorhizobium australicum]